MKIHLFNPENDLALADGNSNYCPPPAARAIGNDLATLPLWYAPEGDVVVLPDALHFEYYAAVSSLFPLPHLFEKGLLPQVDGCSPWGWSALAARRLRDVGVAPHLLPTADALAVLRTLSGRCTAIALCEALRAAGVDTPPPAQYFTSPDDVARFIESVPRSVIKAPWSGSGKGIAWGIGRVEVPVEHFYKGVIRRQGGVVCEYFLDKVVDFAMEFRVADGALSFVGYSLFTCDGGAYSGNVIAADAEIEDFLSSFVGRDTLTGVRDALVCELGRLLGGCYNGYLGVDMMVYRDGGVCRLHPCVEMNLRMNMGAVSRLFYDKFVAHGARGRYLVPNFRKEGEALSLHESLCAAHPAVIENGRLVEGYLNLSPVTAATRYLAYVVIERDAPCVAQLYGCG